MLSQKELPQISSTVTTFFCISALGTSLELLGTKSSMFEGNEDLLNALISILGFAKFSLNAGVLLFVTSILLRVLAHVLPFTSPTLSDLANNVFDRCTNAHANWHNHLTRSFLESMLWLGSTLLIFDFADLQTAENGELTTTLFSFAPTSNASSLQNQAEAYKPLLSALLSATFCGLSTVLIGDALETECSSMDKKLFGTSSSKSSTHAVGATSFFALYLVTLVFLGARSVQGPFLPLIGQASLYQIALGCAIVSSAWFLLWIAGPLFAKASPSRFIGSLVIDRTQNVTQNWGRYPIRSFIESTLFISVCVAIRFLVFPQHALWASYLGCITGMGIIFFGEAVSNAVSHSDDMGWINKNDTMGWEKNPRFECRLEKKKTLKVTMSEVRKHNTAEDCWVVIDGYAFDLTVWLQKHPGGTLPIVAMAGKDATDPFHAFHPPNVFEFASLQAFCKGRVVDYEEECVTAVHKAYREARIEMENEGLFNSNLFYFAFKAAHIMPLLGLAFFFTLYLGWEKLGAVCLGFFWQQSMFIGHDLGHNGVTGDRQMDRKLGLIFGPLLNGVSIGWWKKSHNTHHTVTNSVEYDPDIQHYPVFAISDKFFNGVYSFYHRHELKFDKIWKFLVGYQHFVYWPLMCVVRINLYVQSWIHLLTSSTYNEMHKLEWVMIGLYMLWNGILLGSCESPITYLLTANAFAGLIHIQITLSHFGMESYFGAEPESLLEEKKKTGKASYLETQLRATMDVDCFKSMDWFHGGLQYQVIHHLYPRLPRHNLRAARQKVMKMCEKHGLKYHCYNFLDCNVRVFHSLREAAFQSENCDFTKSMIYEAASGMG